MLVALLVLAGLALAAGSYLVWKLRQRHVDRWLIPYLLETPHHTPGPRQEIHLLLCIADHWEPCQSGKATLEQGRERVRLWVEEYPRQFGGFADSDGRPPRHSFFFPAEEYNAEFVDLLTELCAAGFGEVEVHLHHENDTQEGLRRTLTEFRDTLALRHGLLARHRESGAVMYGFIHGNWALCNSRPDGRHCGVDNELDVLRETGCYADFTLPSAPSATQTPTINRIYYATDKPGSRFCHARGVKAQCGVVPPANALMLIQGPLALDWGNRKWGLIPRLENACIQGSQPAELRRLPQWLRARVQVPGRPDWFFVKLHAHGAFDEHRDAMLGEPMVQFHRDLAAHAARNPNFHYHYVTAREMYNLAKAAEAGYTGSVAGALDYTLLPGEALTGCGGIDGGTGVSPISSPQDRRPAGPT
jgi:hypothetical protein